MGAAPSCPKTTTTSYAYTNACRTPAKGSSARSLAQCVRPAPASLQCRSTHWLVAAANTPKTVVFEEAPLTLPTKLGPCKTARWHTGTTQRLLLLKHCWRAGRGNHRVRSAPPMPPLGWRRNSCYRLDSTCCWLVHGGQLATRHMRRARRLPSHGVHCARPLLPAAAAGCGAWLPWQPPCARTAADSGARAAPSRGP